MYPNFETSIQLSTRAADGLKNYSDKYFHVRADWNYLILKRLNFERYNVILKNVAQLKLAASKSVKPRYFTAKVFQVLQLELSIFLYSANSQDIQLIVWHVN